MVEKHLGQETQVATPGPLPPSVNLEKGYVVISIYLVTWWVLQRALLSVSRERYFIPIVTKTEFADIYNILLRKNLWVRRKIPRE
jgi:hypothetical protein